jgi:hypothetical protein
MSKTTATHKINMGGNENNGIKDAEKNCRRAKKWATNNKNIWCAIKFKRYSDIGRRRTPN